MALLENIDIQAPVRGRMDEILTPEALVFVADLHRTFESRRGALLKARKERQAAFDRGERPGFRDDTRHIREADWKVATTPSDLQDRRVEITGPTERKMVINALNSGARVFMADFEDSNAPTWANMVDGQVNLKDAVGGTISFQKPDGKTYELEDDPATLVVRPRGWHLDEAHMTVDGKPVSGALFDFGLYFFHNAKTLVDNGSGPYFYLPKLERNEEATLWNDVFVHAQERLGVPRGTIRATVLIETITAAFEMDEILHALQEHSAGLNAGRWDYIFSVIKKFRNDPAKVLPDRAQVTMTVPFMRAYSRLLVKTCHRRGAHAIGGMAAFIPSRKDPDVTEKALAAVRADKERETQDGFDGTWVAHPGLVPVAMEIFDTALGERPHQKDRLRDDVNVTQKDLLDTTIPGGKVTLQGLRNNVDVGLRYIASWLSGQGAAAIHNLMEDAATAEISRSQVWQWVRTGTTLEDGRKVDPTFVKAVIDDVITDIKKEVGEETYTRFRFPEARTLFERVALAPDFAEFLTLPAYEVLEAKIEA
ncbi:MAG: malate synthase A [Euryarchaeota archaeon]|nr:malate synthase A [Euryarchaeota archaeon]